MISDQLRGELVRRASSSNRTNATTASGSTLTIALDRSPVMHAEDAQAPTDVGQHERPPLRVGLSREVLLADLDGLGRSTALGQRDAEVDGDVGIGTEPNERRSSKTASAA